MVGHKDVLDLAGRLGITVGYELTRRGRLYTLDLADGHCLACVLGASAAYMVLHAVDTWRAFGVARLTVA